MRCRSLSSAFSGRFTRSVLLRTILMLAGLLLPLIYIIAASAALTPVTPPVAVDDICDIHRPGFLGWLTTNDLNPDHGSLAFTLLTQPTHGSLYFDGGPPNAHPWYSAYEGYSGPDHMSYQICDAYGNCDTADVTINVVNQTPVAVDDTYNVHRPGWIGPFKSNDTDADGDGLTMTILTWPVHGAVNYGTANFPDPWYTPYEGYSGPDHMTYQICDSFGGCDTGDVTINVVNRVPVAADDICHIHRNGYLGHLDANDSDADRDSLTFTLLTQPTRGSLFFDGGTPNAHPWYSPYPGYSGPDSMTYKLCDSFGGCDTAEVTIIIDNASPDAVDDKYKSTGPGYLGYLTDNDIDTDQDSLAFTLLTQPANGSLYFDGGTPNAHPWYTPRSGYTGKDFFDYQICDSFGGCDKATVYINDDDPNAGEDECSSVGNPVNVTNGNMYLQQTDYQLPGIGEGINVTRTYNSNSPHTNLFGRGWSSAYDESITKYNSSNLRLFLPDGRAVDFIWSVNAFIPVQKDFHARVVQNGDGFTLTFKDGRVHRFNLSGKLLSIADRNNNQTTLAYDANNHLASITDSSGRMLNVTSDTNGRVLSITDAAGVVATYAYGSPENSGTYPGQPPGPTTMFSDDFNDNQQHVGKWRYGSLATQLYRGAGALDFSIPVREQNQRIEITPRANVTEEHWNGYVSASGWNLNNARVSVEVPQITNMSGAGTNTIFAIAIDSQNWYMITTSNGRIEFRKCIAGVWDNPSIVYSATAHRFWSIRHNTTGSNTILFETSPDGVTWTTRRNINRQLPLEAMKIELVAGTWQAVAQPGVAVFDNLKVELSNPQPPPVSITDELLSVTYADNSMFKFTYAPAPSLTLTSVTDALGNVLESHIYDGQGRAVTSEKQGGVELYTLNYVSATETHVTDALGRVTKYFFDKSMGHNVLTKVEGTCNCGDSQVQTWTYDGQLNVLSKTDALNQSVSYTYDANGNVLTRTDALGQTTYTYNQFGEVLTITDPMNGVVTNTYDGQGNLLSVKDTLDQTTTFNYDTHGQLLSATDARSNAVNLTYDENGNLTQKTDALNNTTTLAYDARGRLTSTTNALNETTLYAYDAAGRIKKITRPDSSFITYTYDLAGRRTSMTDARNNSTSYGYDGAYRLTSVTDAANKVTTYSYDPMSNLVGVTDALGRTTNREYDSFNRLVKTIYPAASAGATRLQETIEYDLGGRVKKRTDTAGRATQYDYDMANRLVKVTDPALQATQYEYNARSERTAVVDAINQRYTFGYDGMGRVTQATRGGVSMSFAYDAVGNRVQRTDYNGAITNYQYDALNRLTNISYPDSTSASYAYDQLSRMTGATNEQGTVSIGYNNLGHLSSTTDVFNQSLSYGYDPNGNRTQLSMGGAVKAQYQYDALNRLTHLNDNAGAAVTFGYDNLSRLISRSLPNGIATSYQYDGIDRLVRLTDATTQATLADNQYQYNDGGQITQLTDLGGAHNYAYDAVNRLTSATYPNTPAENYTYDGVGNRTSSHQSTSNSHQGFNRLVSSGSTSYSYDSNGNLTQKTDSAGTWVYSWNAENRLTKVTRPDGVSVTYKYDALGRRVQRVPSNGTTTSYVYDGEDVVKDIGSDGSSIEYLNGTGIDNKLRQTNSTTGALYYLKDHLGSTRALTDASGNVIEQISYDSFGNSSGSAHTRYSYTGREWDADAGLYYYRARFYDAQAGRFISEDPIGFGGGVNFYAYVSNSPVNLSDPLGLCPRNFKQPTRCDLELRITRIPTTLYLGLHAYVLIRQSGTNDIPSYYSARPNAEDQLEAGHGSYNSESPDYESAPSASVQFSASGSCDDIIRSFNETEYLTNRSGIKYRAFSNNSNAYIYTLLKRAGLDPDGLGSQLFATWGLRPHSGNSTFPGWGQTLSLR